MHTPFESEKINCLSEVIFTNCSWMNPTKLENKWEICLKTTTLPPALSSDYQGCKPNEYGYMYRNCYPYVFFTSTELMYITDSVFSRYHLYLLHRHLFDITGNMPCAACYSVEYLHQIAYLKWYTVMLLLSLVCAIIYGRRSHHSSRYQGILDAEYVVTSYAIKRKTVFSF